MNLKNISWEQFKTYLLIDKKLASTADNILSFKSRFKLLSKHFQRKSFNRENVNSFIYDLKIKGYSNEYLNKIIGCCKHLCTMHSLNFLDSYSLFKCSRKIYEIMTVKEMSKIESLQVPYDRESIVRNQIFFCLYRLLRETGCRIGEVLKLTHQDVTENTVIFKETKNGETRIVPISSSLYSQIKTLPRKKDFVFYSVFNPTLSRTTVTTDLKQRAKILGFKKRVWLHLFRHSIATTLVQKGIDTATLAKILGHKSLDSTQRYNQTRVDHLRKAQEKFNPAFK